MATKDYYECHITIDPTPPPHRTAAQHEQVVKDLLAADKWTFSHIHHDIVLGVGPKFYATKHFNTDRINEDALWAILQSTRAKWERKFFGAGPLLKILRCKIELVLRDERYDQEKQA